MRKSARIGHQQLEWVELGSFFQGSQNLAKKINMVSVIYCSDISLAKCENGDSTVKLNLMYCTALMQVDAAAM